MDFCPVNFIKILQKNSLFVGKNKLYSHVNHADLSAILTVLNAGHRHSHKFYLFHRSGRGIIKKIPRKRKILWYTIYPDAKMAPIRIKAACSA